MRQWLLFSYPYISLTGEKIKAMNIVIYLYWQSVEACFTILAENSGAYHAIKKCFQQLLLLDQSKNWLNICTDILQQAEMDENFIEYDNNLGIPTEIFVHELVLFLEATF